MGGMLTVKISAGGAATDTLGLLSGNNISFTGMTSGNVLYDGDLIGTYTLTSGATSTLTVTFNPVGTEIAGNTTANPVPGLAIQALIQQVTFSTGGVAGDRSVSFQVFENGGASDAIASQTVNVASLTPTVTLSLPPPSIVYDGTTDVTNWVQATVTGVAGAPAPTGATTFTYYTGTTTNGAPLNSSPTGAGTYTVVANYAGDANYSSATSSPVTFTIGQATPTVTLASPPPSIVYDGTTDITNWVQATVTGVAGAAAPTGTTTFAYYAGTTTNSTPLTSSPTGAGTYTVVANYAGDANYLSATSSPVTFTIGQATPTVTLPTPPTNLVYDGTTDVTNWVQATVTGVAGAAAPTGSATYTYYAGSTTSSTPLGSSPIGAGTYTVVAKYAGDSNYAAAASLPATFTIGQATPTVTLPTPPTNLVYDGTTDVTNWVQATVTGVAGAAAPTGTVTYTYYTGSTTSSTPLGSSPIIAGTYTVVANYVGNANYSAAMSSPTTFTINQAGITVTLASPPNSIVYDGTTDVTSWVQATVTGVAGQPAPTGSVTFAYYSGSTTSGSPLSSSPVNAGTYTVVANYPGDADYPPASSASVTFTIAKAGVSVTLASPPPSIVYDGTTDVTNWVKATVTGVAGAPAPSGTTTFTYYTGMTPTGTPLTSSPTGAGTYTVVANYSGDSNYAGTTSSPTTFTIAKAGVSVTLASPPPSIVYDGTTDVTNWVKATVTGVAGAPAPSGTTTFTYYTGMTPTGTPLTSSPTGAGTYTVVANYSGDSNYAGTTSSPTTFTIAKAGVSVTLASPPPSIVYDGTTDVTNWVKATVTGVAGAPAPSGTTTFTYYTGMTPTGTPLTSSPTAPARTPSWPTTAATRTTPERRAAPRRSRSPRPG